VRGTADKCAREDYGSWESGGYYIKNYNQFFNLPIGTDLEELGFKLNEKL
jgi:hypothetical protein